MKKAYRTIRVSEEVYQELIHHRAELEQINRTRMSFSDTIDLLMNEIAGMEYEIAALKGQAQQAQAETA